MAGIDPAEEINELAGTLRSIQDVLDLGAMRKQIEELEGQVASPDLWDDPEQAQKVTSKLSHMQGELNRVEGLVRRLDDLSVLYELAAEEGDEDTRAEADKELASLRSDIGALEVRTLLSGPYDAREALLTINSQAGGVDAADWAEMLLRMYLRWAERQGLPDRGLWTPPTRKRPASSRPPSGQGALRLRHAPWRARHPPSGPHQPVRQPGPPPDLVRRVEVVPVVEQTDHIEIPEDEPHRRLPLVRTRRPGRQHDRLGGPHHPPADRHRGHLPERALAAPEPRLGDERAAGQAAGAQAAGGGRARCPSSRGHDPVGHADPQLRAAIRPDREGSTHGHEAGNPTAVLNGDIDGFIESVIPLDARGQESEPARCSSTRARKSTDQQ